MLAPWTLPSGLISSMNEIKWKTGLHFMSVTQFEVILVVLLCQFHLLGWAWILIHMAYQSPITSCIIHPSISFFYLVCCPCPILWCCQHQAMWNTDSQCISGLWVIASQGTITDINLHTISNVLALGNLTVLMKLLILCYWFFFMLYKAFDTMLNQNRFRLSFIRILWNAENNFHVHVCTLTCPHEILVFFVMWNL